MIGIDEVGRGCWAGPLLVVAARQNTELPSGLTDSKLLTKKRRETLFYDIQLSCDLGEGWVLSAEIDEMGLAEAMRLGVKRALVALASDQADEIIMDGNINYCGSEYSRVKCVVDADALHPIVSAASIYAKVLRDKHMTELARNYPAYGFDTHVGYGTKAHLAALLQYGVTEHHRKSFRPVREVLERTSV